MIRIDGRSYDELRPIHITPRFQSFAEGSAFIEVGRTRIVCAVSVENRVPHFLRGTGGGWLTAEYGMLPRSTMARTPREGTQGRVAGRTCEIQRLIGRTLRAAVDLRALGERTLTVDCDVIEADGGTRCAAITGGYVALVQALETLLERGVILSMPIKAHIAAVSVGVVGGEELLDLCYEEDCHASVDFNVAMTTTGDFIEVQGTAESRPFSKGTLDSILALAERGIRQLFLAQKAALEPSLVR